MKRQYTFYICLIIIYILFLNKNILFGISKKNIEPLLCNTKEHHYEEEYQNLSKMLNLNLPNYEVAYSKIIFRDIYQFYDKITITKGTNDNLKEGSVVVDDKGLLGVINKCYLSYSEVSLITNSNTNISVKINNSYGILSSSDNILYVKNIKLNNEIKENDIVYTSGLTNTPSDIVIGRVKKINKDNLELEYIIEVEPLADLHNINYVGVIS